MNDTQFPRWPFNVVIIGFTYDDPELCPFNVFYLCGGKEMLFISVILNMVGMIQFRIFSTECVMSILAFRYAVANFIIGTLKVYSVFYTMKTNKLYYRNTKGTLSVLKNENLMKYSKNSSLRE